MHKIYRLCSPAVVSISCYSLLTEFICVLGIYTKPSLSLLLEYLRTSTPLDAPPGATLSEATPSSSGKVNSPLSLSSTQNCRNLLSTGSCRHILFSKPIIHKWYIHLPKFCLCFCSHISLFNKLGGHYIKWAVAN